MVRRVPHQLDDVRPRPCRAHMSNTPPSPAMRRASMHSAICYHLRRSRIHLWECRMEWIDPQLRRLGLKRISERAAPIFLDERLSTAFQQADDLAKEAPSPWELTDSGAGPGGMQPEATAGYKAKRRRLSPQDEKLGRERLLKAYERIEAQLKEMDNQIAALEHTFLRRVIEIVAIVSIASAIVIIFIGVFTHSALQLTGREGAATLLLGSGVSLLVTTYVKDRNLRTLSSRVRAELNGCLAREPYVDAHQCFTRTLGDLKNAFLSTRWQARDILQVKTK
jgi:hypothetical protein